MSEGKHTPGPWTALLAENWGDREVFLRIMAEFYDNTLAHEGAERVHEGMYCVECNEDPQGGGDWVMICLCGAGLRSGPNAHLLAAAPKLLEALKAITDSFPRDDTWWCPHCGPTDCRYDGRCEQCGFTIEDLAPESLIEQAEAAIAKAEPKEDAI